MNHLYILGGFASYMGRNVPSYPGGKAGAEVMREVGLELPTDAIDYIRKCGQGGSNITRSGTFGRVSERIPALLDLQCGSALEAISAAAARKQDGGSGHCRGMESSSYSRTA